MPASSLASRRSGPPAIAAGKIKHVLVIYAADRLLPAAIEDDIGIREALAKSDPSAVVNDEFLNIPDFDAQAYHSALMAFLRAKYSQNVPDVIVAASEKAIDFLLRNRTELFPLAPIVHLAVSRSFLRQELPPLPADVVGVPVDFDFSGTIAQALEWRPQARRLVVVTGASSADQVWEPQLRDAVSPFKDRVTVEFLAGLPTSALLKRLSELGDDAVVFTTGYFKDGEGRSFTPRESAEIMATASTAPIFGSFNTFMGTGIVGGRMPNFRAMGRQAGVVVEPAAQRRNTGLAAPARGHARHVERRLAAAQAVGHQRDIVAERRDRAIQGTDLVGDTSRKR